jgi:acyl transferase domain-containing protein
MGYLELHGEGSLLRDAVELRAAREAWEGAGGNSGICPIGSVKANIGHLLLAAGVAGLIKACLVLRHGKAPPHPFKAVLAKYAGFDAAERRLPGEASDLIGNASGEPRIVGVNSTGIAGTNCFMVCAESPRPFPRRPKVPRPMNKRSFWLGPPPTGDSAGVSKARDILSALRDGKINPVEARTRLGLESRPAELVLEERARLILTGLRSGEIPLEAAKAGLVSLSAYRQDAPK